MTYLTVVSLYFPPFYSGAGTSLARLLDNLPGTDYHVDVITLGSSSSPRRPGSEFNIFEVVVEGDVTAVDISKCHLLKFFVMAPLLVLKCRRNNVIYFNGFLKVFAPLLVVAKVLGHRVIVKITGDEEDSVAAHKQSFAGRAFLLLSKFLVDSIVAINQKMSEDARAQYPGRVLTLGNVLGPQMPLGRRVGDLSKKDEIKILYLGVLSRRKGIDRLMSAWPLIFERVGSERKVALDIVGPIDPLVEIDEAILDRSDVHYHGEVKPDKVAEMLNSADILVFPSRSEGLPNAVLEAFSHGVAVVGYDIPGVRDLLESNRGVLVNDEGEFVRRTCELILDDPMRRSIVKSCLLWLDAYDEAYGAMAYHRLFARVSN